MPPEWKEREEKRKAEEALRNTQGINIRRRPVTGPPIHNVGPFQFKIQSEGNIPRNILEEIVWHKDVEVAQVEANSVGLQLPLFEAYVSQLYRFGMLSCVKFCGRQ